MAGDFDAYHKWLSIPPHEQPPHHYRLLAVNLFEGDLDVIENAADRQMKHLRDFQTGKHAELSQKLLNEIAAARHCLLDPQRKAAYDAQLRQREQAKRTEQPLRQPLAKQQNPSASGVGEQGSAKPANPVATFKSATLESLSPVRKRTPAANVSPVLLLAAIGLGALLLLVAVVLGVFYLGGSSPPMPPEVAGLNPPQALVDPVGAIDPLPSVNPPHSDPPATDPVSNPPTPVDPPRTDNPPLDPEPATPPQPEPRDTITPTMDDPQPPKRSPIDALFAAAEDTRTPVPGAEARATKAKQIEVLFPADNARTYAQKLNLVQQLLKTARDTKSDADAQYMLLETARDVARTTGNIAVAFEAIDALEEQFQIDGPAMRAESLVDAAKAASPLSLKAQVIDEGVKVVDVLFEQDRYAEATKLIGSLRTLARKTRDKDQLAAVGARQVQSSELLQSFKAAQPAIDALKANPEDAAAATTAGKFHAFIKGDWPRGLVMLSVSSDESLKKLAQQEMAVPTSHDDQKALADAWLKQASTAKGLEAERQRARAAMWYTKVQSELAGLAKVEVQKKLSAIGKLNVDGGDVFELPPELVATRDDAPSTPSGSPGSLSPVDLLALIDVEKDATRGNWQMQDGKLISPNMPFATVQIPYFPPQEYIVEAVVSSPNHGCDLSMGLVRDGRHFQIVTEGYGGQWSGINVLDHRFLPNGNPTAREGRLTRDNEPSRIVYRVTRGRIELMCDGEMIAEFDGGSSRLHAHGGFKVVNPLALYLGVCDRELTIHSLKLVPLSGQGWPARDERGVPLPMHATLPEGETATFVVRAQAQGLEARPFESDGPFTVSAIDGKATLTASDSFVYFHVDDAFAFDLPRRSNEKIYAVVTVLDRTEGEIYVQYDAHPSVWASTPRADMLGTGNWKEIAFELPGARLTNRQNNSADFRVACNFKGVVVHKMELRRCRAASGTSDDSDPERDAAGNLWTAAAGGTGGNAYEDTFGRPDARLVGLNVGWSHAVIESIEPVYSTSKGVQLGQFVGETMGTTDTAKVIAKEGYAVGGLVVSASDYLNGLQVIFMRQRGDVLDPKDSYTSEWLGSRGGSVTRLGGTGDPVIGIHGRAASWMDSVGLIIRDSARSP